MITNYSEITPYIKELAALSDNSNHIVSQMYLEHDVKRGLRDLNGNGVVAGLTEVSCIKAKERDETGKETVLMNKQNIDHIIKILEEKGTDYWFDSAVKDEEFVDPKVETGETDVKA